MDPFVDDGTSVTRTTGSPGPLRSTSASMTYSPRRSRTAAYSVWVYVIDPPCRSSRTARAELMSAELWVGVARFSPAITTSGSVSIAQE